MVKWSFPRSLYFENMRKNSTPNLLLVVALVVECKSLELYYVLSPPPSPHWRAEFCLLTTPKTASDVFPVSRVAGCTIGAPCWLHGNPSISLAGTEKQINFSQQSPKMLKMASTSFIHALLLFLGLFLRISGWCPWWIKASLIVTRRLHHFLIETEMRTTK